MHSTTTHYDDMLLSPDSSRVKLAVNRATKECVAVKILHSSGKTEVSHDSLKKEVSRWVLYTLEGINYLNLYFMCCPSVCPSPPGLYHEDA